MLLYLIVFSVYFSMLYIIWFYTLEQYMFLFKYAFYYIILRSLVKIVPF